MAHHRRILVALASLAITCVRGPERSPVMGRAGTVEVSATEPRALVVQFGREFTE